MKEIIYPNNINTINFSEVKKMVNPIIGFQKPDGEKIVLIHVSYNSNRYFARVLHGWDNGNGYSPHGKDKQTIQQWCEFFHKSHKAKIYVFDSPKELFTWKSFSLGW